MHGADWYLKRRSHLHVSRWIQTLKSENLMFEIVVLEWFDSVDRPTTLLNAAEARWIEIGRQALGERFTNAQSGGFFGGRSWTLEERAQISSRNKIYFTTPKGRAQALARSVALKGFVFALSKESIDKRTASQKIAQRNRASTPEGRQHLAAIRKMSQTPEAIAKMVVAKRERAIEAQKRANQSTGSGSCP